MTTEVSNQIFFSYSRRDIEFSVKLANRLRNDGVQLWMDDGLIRRTSRNWQQEISDGIADSRALIAVISSNYIISRYCQMEMARATDLGRVIYPIVLEHVPVEQQPLGISGIQFMDFSNWQDEAEFERRLQLLLERLHEDNTIQFTKPPSPEQQYLYHLLERLTSNSGIIDFVDNANDYQQGDEISVRPNPFQHSYAPTTYRVRDEHGKQDSTVHPISALAEVAEQHPRMMILGKPGAGKTSTLYGMVFDAVRANFENPRTAPVPVLIDLSQWQSLPETRRNVKTGSVERYFRVPSLMEVIENQIIIGQTGRYIKPLYSAEELLKSAQEGDVIFFLDGLNELEQQEEEDQARLEAIQRFLYPENGEPAPKKVIITCRIEDYQQQLDLLLPGIVIQPLDQQSIEVFAQQHLGERAEDFLQKILPDTQQTTQNTKVYELVRIPFLLSAITYFYMQHPDAELPQTEAEVIERLMQVLWDRHSAQRDIRGDSMSYSAFEQHVSRLAYRMIAANKGSSVSEDFAWEQLMDVGIVDRVRKRISGFLSRGKDEEDEEDLATKLMRIANEAKIMRTSGTTVGFVHDLLRDYLAARYVVNNPNQLEKLKPSRLTEAGRQPANPRLEMVFSFAFSLGKNNDERLIAYLMASDPYLAAEFIAKGASVRRRTAEDLALVLLEKASSANRVTLQAAGKALVQAGDGAVLKIAHLADDETAETEQRMQAINLLGYAPCKIAETTLERLSREGMIYDKSLEEAEKKLTQLDEKISYMETDEFIQKELKNKRRRDMFLAEMFRLVATIVVLVMNNKVGGQQSIQENVKKVGKEFLLPREESLSGISTTMAVQRSRQVEKFTYKKQEIAKIVQARRDEINKQIDKLRSAAAESLSKIRA